MKKDLVILLCGNINNIMSAHKLSSENIIFIKEDEKILSRFAQLKSIIKSQDFNSLYFATIDLSYQRFIIFMKLYILILNFGKGSIIDEAGNADRFNIFKLILIEIPKLLIEIVYTIFQIVYWQVKFSIIRGKYLSK